MFNNVDVDALGQSCLTHTPTTTFALFLFLCCLYQALEVLLFCLSCPTRCLLLFNSALGRVNSQQRDRTKDTHWKNGRKEGRMGFSSSAPFCRVSIALRSPQLEMVHLQHQQADCDVLVLSFPLNQTDSSLWIIKLLLSADFLFQMDLGSAK